MKVMLHGAVNMQNFGDYLFAELFYNRLKENGIEPVFYNHRKYGISHFFMNHLGYEPQSISTSELLRSCDALVYIPGGYFRATRKRSILKKIRHIKRYLIPAIPFLRARKPIYILGVGAGPFDNGLFSKFAKRILNTAKVVTVRNEESLEYCKKLGVTRDVLVTSDTALVVDDYFRKNKKDSYQIAISGKKILALHFVPENATVQFCHNCLKPAIARFLNTNPDYQFIIIQDSSYSKKRRDAFLNMFKTLNPQYIPYKDPWELCAYLNKADMIITFKLHVGIVGAVFGGSVLSFPEDYQKTKRFYNQIKESDRCISKDSADQEKVYQMMEYYKNKKITIPDELKWAAETNLAYLDTMRQGFGGFYEKEESNR